MSYNHAGDLPDNYIFHDATNIIKNPGLRSIWHEGAEKGNFLNEIGHSAIQRSLMSMAGSDDSEFGGLGATIYEIERCRISQKRVRRTLRHTTTLVA